MSSFGVTKCDKCGAEIRIEYGKCYATGSKDDPHTKILSIRGHDFCIQCAAPIIRALIGVLEEMRADQERFKERPTEL